MTAPREPAQAPGNQSGAHPAGAPNVNPDATAEERAHHESLGDMFKEVSQDMSTLIRQEMELAKAELRTSASKAGKGAGMITGAVIGGYMVLLFLSLALWAGIGYLTGLAWSAVIVAVVWAIIAAILAAVGKKEMKSVKGVPQTAETAKEIPEKFK